MKKLLEETGTTLYRGTGLTKKEVQQYRDRVGAKVERSYYSGNITSKEDTYMTMTGFISTSMNKSDAQKFAWSNHKTGHEATLFEIMWKS